MSASILPGRFEQVSYALAGERLIADLDFTLAAGPISIILGPNGAGKSLTLRLAHGLIAPTSGRITWQADARQNQVRPGQVRSRQAMVFQRPVMLRRSAAANIDYALKAAGLARQERQERRRQVLRDTGLESLAERPARVLSTGEQQRLALARAWALRPEVIFLDEPTASLDPAATAAVESIIGALNRADSKIVMTTHDLGQARRLAGEILFLHRGRLVEQRPAAAFFAGPKSEAARAFLKGELHW